MDGQRPGRFRRFCGTSGGPQLGRKQTSPIPGRQSPERVNLPLGPPRAGTPDPTEFLTAGTGQEGSPLLLPANPTMPLHPKLLHYASAAPRESKTGEDALGRRDAQARDRAPGGPGRGVGVG